MPGLNKQGPRGEGPGTGGQRGRCDQSEISSSNPQGQGRGLGQGRGQGQGRGRGQGRGLGQGRRTGNVETPTMPEGQDELLRQRPNEQSEEEEKSDK